MLKAKIITLQLRLSNTIKARRIKSNTNYWFKKVEKLAKEEDAEQASHS